MKVEKPTLCGQGGALGNLGGKLTATSPCDIRSAGAG